MAGQSVASSANHSEAFFGELKHNWGWLLCLGVLFIILGIVGLGRLFALSSAGTLFFGILIVIAGVAQLIEAIKCKGWKGMAYHVLIAVLYVVGGVFVIREPLAAKRLLTWILGAVLICVGIVSEAPWPYRCEQREAGLCLCLEASSRSSWGQLFSPIGHCPVSLS